MTDAEISGPLADTRDDFLSVPEQDRLELLLEFSQELPAAPVQESDAADTYERVSECQSPVFISVDVSADRIVTMHAKAPKEAPTTRGFASILVHGISGMSVDDVLAVPDDFPMSLGLSRVVSPLRLAGMAGMLRRAKRQVQARDSV